MSKKAKDSLLSIGSAFSSLGAILATSCCIVPIVLVNLGLGGAWVANLAELKPYRMYFIAVAVVFAGIGLFIYIRNLMQPCDACEPKSFFKKIGVPLILSISVLLIALALLLPSVEPYILRMMR